jgi:hypothetical protein
VITKREKNDNKDDKDKEQIIRKRKAFMFMFALIQNSVDIREINRLLEHIYIMLNFEYIDNKLMNSINVISRCIIGTELDEKQIFSKRTNDEQKRDQIFDECKKINVDEGYNF